MRALIISADQFEDSELLVPIEQLQKKNIATDIASLKKGRIQGKHGNVVHVDLSIDEIDVSMQCMTYSFFPVAKHPAG